ncbi:MAG: RDD family protein [Nitrospirota bacterium]|nr:RDD family protein [Nitrospirota bacterium]
MHWYYVDGSKKIGPLTDEDIGRLVEEGVVSDDTLVWNEIISKWRSYGRVKSSITAASPRGLSPETGTTLVPVRTEDSGGSFCSVCGRICPDEEMTLSGDFRICAACKPVFFQSERDGGDSRSVMDYAGFWIRFLAKTIDIAITSLGGFLFVITGVFLLGIDAAPFGVVPTSLVFFQYIIPVTYTTFFVGRFAATPGKMICGLKVVTPDGGRVSYLRAFGRYFAGLLSALILMMGYVMIAFDKEKRALHDHICWTRVIRR